MIVVLKPIVSNEALEIKVGDKIKLIDNGSLVQILEINNE